MEVPMKCFYLLILTLCIHVLSFSSSLTNPINEEGTEFWVCFEKNFKEPEARQERKFERNDIDSNGKVFSISVDYGAETEDKSLTLELFISSSTDNKVIIENKALNYYREVNIKAGTVEKIDIEKSFQIIENEKPAQLSLHIKSEKNITINGLNRRFQTTDSFTALPIECLGIEYMVMCSELSDGLQSQFAIISTEDNNEIELFASKNYNLPEQKIKLNKGEVYQIASTPEPSDYLQSTNDLTGTLIKSKKKIAVFSGHQCAYIPNKTIACNHLVEQIPPVNSWGNKFYLGAMAKRSKYTLRVLASEDNTNIIINSEKVATINKGQFYENHKSGDNIIIETSKPALVAQFSQGFRNGDSIGDPMMMLIRSVKDFRKSYRFATPIQGSWNHYINVTVPKEAFSNLTIDGIKMEPNLFKPYKDSAYLIGQIQIQYGTHLIECTQPFGICSYGFGFGDDSYDAYGNM
jgi:adhesin/invasin